MANRSFPVLMLVLTLSACATVPREKLYPAATALVRGTSSDMNGSGYWIARHPAPDTPLLDAEGIAALNADIRASAQVRDLAAWVPPEGEKLAAEFRDSIEWVRSLKVFQADGHKVDTAFLNPLIDLMDIGAAGKLPGRYGFLVAQTDLRALPTSAGLYDGPGDPYIDNLQASSLEPGEPLRILHRSRDGSWLYVAGELASGWVSAAKVALTDQGTFERRYREAAKGIVVVGRADLFADEAMVRFAGYARMGTRLVLAGQSAGAALKVSMPGRDEEGLLREEFAWIDANAVVDRPLPYTPRTIYRQAFTLLNAPYGWGGSFGQQDCSQFLCQVFSTVGITLPRNSGRQAKVGTPLAGFRGELGEEEKARVLAEGGVGAATLLRFPGHIMLYLGVDGGEPYAIHSTWSYLEKRGFKDINRLVNRVVVSDLRLGSGGEKGSHLHRLTDITIVVPAERKNPTTSQ